MAATAKVHTPRRTSQDSSELNGHGPPSAALEAIGARPRRAQRRPTKQASYELCNHAKAYLEGRQYASGYDFLYNLLAAGTSISTPAQPYIGFTAPPAYFAFASSLIAYPPITTKSRNKDARKGAEAALRYLQCIHTTIDGAAYPIIRQAFSFPAQHSRRRARGHRNATASPSPGGDDIELIAGDAANAESIWTRAEDFWQLVGWAFNCSVAQKQRWKRWKLWLGIMLDFLEADWEFCARRSKDATSVEAVLQESLLWQYIKSDAGSVNRGVRRRIVRAILAAASTESLKDYPEIWTKETEKPNLKSKDLGHAREVDFETGDMADYQSDQDMADASNDVSDEELSDEHDAGFSYGGKRDLHNSVEEMGGAQAIELRQRFIALLAKVSIALPTEFTTLSDLFDNILEDFIRLPIALFQVLLSTSKLTGQTHIAYCTNLVLPLVSGRIPDFFRYEPTQEDLESALLPLKGTTQGFAANAKISLLLEQIFMYMMSHDALEATKALRTAMEAGIQARHSVYGTGKGKRGNAEEEAAGKAQLEACSERLLGMLEILEMKGGKSPQPLEAKYAVDQAFPSFGTGSSLSPPPSSETDEDE
ncbi:hypothetical protein DE146DRAFT_61944 [Phaeosphaeria sp. MPI-PUGE-AT-0046c]|nr:hypothetical protein DE146DRAFT_61944 [Phaeosphaeria sp. MPI-PUGE-AT-0046c]